MANSDFDYYITSYGNSNLSTHVISAYGANGMSATDDTVEPFSYHRKYKTNMFLANGGGGVSTSYSQTSTPYIIQTNYLKTSKLVELGIANAQGEVQWQDKIISIRAKVKIKSRQVPYNIYGGNRYYLSREWVGLCLFGGEPTNVLDYHDPFTGTERFAYGTFPDNNDIYNFSGYNLLLSHDGPGMGNLEEVNTDSLFTEEKKHISLYAYGENVKSGIYNTTFTLSSIPFATNNYKLYECEPVSGISSIDTDQWYWIRLDCVPQTTTSYKLIAYLGTDNGLWNKAGEIIREQGDSGFVDNGRIGFLTGVFDYGSAPYDEATQGHTLESETYIDSFSIHTEALS